MQDLELRDVCWTVNEMTDPFQTVCIVVSDSIPGHSPRPDACGLPPAGYVTLCSDPLCTVSTLKKIKITQ